SQTGVWVMNEVRFVYAKPGIKLTDIAKMYDIPLKKLPKFNAPLLNKSLEQLPEKQRIFLEPKRKEFHGEQKWHVVQANETLQRIADYYAIQTEPLRKRNRLFEKEEPTIGTKLKLNGKKIKMISLRK
ncbi:MAG: LysM peptidoglycan-binding domain-containing protein, partial [Saprospiraceae bacterium]